MTCLCWAPSGLSSACDSLGCKWRSLYAASTVVTHLFADALDLQAAAACSHGPVFHQSVGLVQANHVVPRVEAWVEVSKACMGTEQRCRSEGGRCCSTWPLLLPPAHSPQEPLSMAILKALELLSCG